MRLTLRTLLAYLDDILDPADHEQLKQKIEASEFAKDLVHRTRDTMRRLRLSAPQVTGSGIGLDPNSVSEYLDNTLPPDSVADFERICLESEMHLAEVVSCHHVLTMVLGEPAEVDSESRQRMYDIQDEKEKRRRLRVEPAHVVEKAVAREPAPLPLSSYPPVEVAPNTAPASSDIPDYLRASRWSPASMILAAAAVLMIATASYWLLFPEDRQGTTPDVAQSNGELAPPITPDVAVIDRPEEGTNETTGQDVEPPAAGTSDGTTSVSEPPRLDAPANTLPSDSGTPAGDQPDATVGATPEIPEPGDASKTAVSADPSDPMPPAEPPAENVSAEVTSEADIPTGAPVWAEGVEETAQPSGPVAVAFYSGGDDVLAKYDRAEETWNRLSPRSEIMEEGRLLTLPGYRSRVSLPSGIDLALAGGTLIDVKLAPPTPPAEGANVSRPVTSVVEVGYGRLLLVNPTAGETAVALVIGDTSTDVRLQQNTTLAVEVERPFTRGQDPRQAPAQITTRLFAIDGGVTWGETNFVEPMQWMIVEGKTAGAEPLSAIPEWIDHGATDRLEEMAAGRIEGRLTSDRPLAIQLQELFYEGRRAEDKSLAARSSVYVGQFGPFVEALRDPEQRNAWNSLIQSLRHAMALSPDSAEQVWNELVKQRGEESAGDLYEMLCGYSKEQIGETPEQIKAGAIATLIDRLEHETLDYRVLAFQNLLEITGKNLAYVPTARADDRERRVRTWRQRLEDGELGPHSEQ